MDKSLTLRDMNQQLVKDMKKEARALNVTLSKLTECLYVLHLLRCNFSKREILSYLQQNYPKEFTEYNIAAKL
jgi:hypothetical protein